MFFSFKLKRDSNFNPTTPHVDALLLWCGTFWLIRKQSGNNSIPRGEKTILSTMYLEQYSNILHQFRLINTQSIY